MGSRGSGYDGGWQGQETEPWWAQLDKDMQDKEKQEKRRKEENLADLYKSYDEINEKIFTKDATPEDIQAWNDAYANLKASGKADDFIDWISEGKPDVWPKKNSNESKTQEPTSNGNNIDHIVGPDGTSYLVNLDTGEMWREGETPPSQKEPEKPYQPGSMTGDKFSQDRKDKALWTTDKSLADSILRPSAGAIYPTFDKDTKMAFSSYTAGGYGPMNSALAHGNKGNEKTALKIDKMTEALDKSELPVDMWVQRGIGKSVATNMFGENFSVASIQKMIANGDIVHNKPFMSTAAAKGFGFTNKPVILNLYAPKGTKGIYAEPFSSCGGGKTNWDGKSDQMYLSSEFEVIIQRGAQLRPLKVTEGSDGVLYVDMQIEGFKY